MPAQLKIRLRFLWVFYQSTLSLSAIISVALACLAWPNLLKGFGLGFMTGGTVLTLMYKELSRKNEYYFYYNRGLTKLQLIFCCVSLNFIAGLIICLI